MKLCKNMPNKEDSVVEILFFRTNTNGIAYHVDIT